MYILDISSQFNLVCLSKKYINSCIVTGDRQQPRYIKPSIECKLLITCIFLNVSLLLQDCNNVEIRIGDKMFNFTSTDHLVSLKTC